MFLIGRRQEERWRRWLTSGVRVTGGVRAAVTTSTGARWPQVAVDDRGDAAAVWATDAPDSRTIVEAQQCLAGVREVVSRRGIDLREVDVDELVGDLPPVAQRGERRVRQPDAGHWVAGGSL